MDARVSRIWANALGALILVLPGTGCNPVGEPVVIPASYNGGKILEPDGGYIRLDCEQSGKLPDTLALYCFDGDDTTSSVVLDSTGKHDASVVGTKTRMIRGPSCCGMALQFSESNTTSYIEVSDSPDWQLDQGSISLWLRVDACPARAPGQGLISRASSDRAETGHFGLFILPACSFAVNLTGDSDSIEVRANTALTPGQWAHVNVNFGPPGLELYLDGRLVASDETTLGTSGNHNPWVIGADTSEANPGAATPPAHFLTGAAIDLLRISSARNKLIVLK